VRRDKATPERLSAFSDGVFAVLITVLVLELRPPGQPTFRALLALWPTWLSYAVSYLFIAIVWANHHHLMRYATEATPRLVWFNFAHLFSVSLLPLSTAGMTGAFPKFESYRHPRPTLSPRNGFAVIAKPAFGRRRMRRSNPFFLAAWIASLRSQ
jgi:uncharacterized membrane protein